MSYLQLLSPARLRAFLPACAPGSSHTDAFALVALVTVVLLAQGVPGESLALVLLALAVLTLVVSGGPTPPGLAPLMAAYSGQSGQGGEVVR